MVRSLNWPDLWWQISKIRDIQVVGIYDLMKRWRFETNRISSVTTAQPQSQKPVFDFDLTWWPDLWWPGVELFTQGVLFNCEQLLKKWRHCAPPFFRYPRKPEGWAFFAPPPSSARDNKGTAHCTMRFIQDMPEFAPESESESTLKHRLRSRSRLRWKPYRLRSPGPGNREYRFSVLKLRRNVPICMDNVWYDYRSHTKKRTRSRSGHIRSLYVTLWFSHVTHVLWFNFDV